MGTAITDITTIKAAFNGFLSLFNVFPLNIFLILAIVITIMSFIMAIARRVKQ